MLLLLILLAIVGAVEQLLIIIDLQVPLLNSYIITSINDIDPQSTTKLITTMQYNSQASERFDYMEFQNKESLECYQLESMQFTDAPICLQECRNYVNFKTNQKEIVSEMQNNKHYVIDNTQFPCDGSYYQAIYPWVAIVTEFSVSTKYFYVEIGVIAVFLVVWLMEIIAIIMMQYKIRKLEKKNKQQAQIPYLLNRITQNST